MMNLSKTAFVGAVAIAAALAAAPASAAYKCASGHHYKNGFGVAPSQSAALVMAKQSWSATIKKNYGLAWSVWKVAKGKQQTCTQAANGMKQCIVRAKPCKYVVQ